MGWLALGTIASLIMGILSGWTTFKALDRTNKMRAKLDEALITGGDPTPKMPDFAKIEQLTWKTWFPSYVGGASFVFFVFGVGTIAGSLIRASL